MSRPASRPVRRVAAALLALGLGLAPPAAATWSIVLVDSATGEVAVGTATCLPGTDLRAFVPVIVVGVGAGATQSQVETSGKHKRLIFDELTAGTAPADIIELLKAAETVPVLGCSRQFGVADMNGQAAGFSGGCNGQFKAHRVGAQGTMAYSIQGNVITGLPVLLAARAAVLNTPGSIAEKLMAAMEAARVFGGDGRCSCDMNPPADACGAPPAGGFEKSAHVGTVIVARVGDTDGPCLGTGCANGDYWLDLNYQGGTDDIDPVFWLQDAYATFKERMAGHADGVESFLTWNEPEPLPGGGAVAEAVLVLRDLDGTPLTTGGAQISIGHADDSAGLSSRQSVKDHGDGTYTLRFLADATTGTDRFVITVRDGLRPAVLYPFPEIEYPVPLLASTDEVSAAAGAVVRFDLTGPASAAGRPFVLGLSLDGPGEDLVLPGSRAALPLRRDPVLAALPWLVDEDLLRGVPGTLDASGRAVVELELPAGLLAPLEGRTLRAAWCTWDPADFASGATLLRVAP